MSATEDTEPLVAHALGIEHLAGGLVLSGAAGWNQTADDWRLVLERGRGWGYSTRAGELVATTCVIPYEGSFAWISVVLVAEAWRRRGLARRLTEQALAALQDTGAVPLLDATPAGREVYVQLGFRDAWHLERLLLKQIPAQIVAVPVDGVRVRPITAADWCAVHAYDRAVFGADRGWLLEHLRSRLPEAALLAEDASGIRGFLLGRDGCIASMLGPLAADSAEIARLLIAKALYHVPAPLFIDLPQRQSVVREWLAAIGFKIGRPFARMAHDRATTFEDAERLVLSAGPEFG